MCTKKHQLFEELCLVWSAWCLMLLRAVDIYAQEHGKSVQLLRYIFAYYGRSDSRAAAAS